MSRLENLLGAEPELPLVGRHTTLTAGALSLNVATGVAAVGGTPVPLSSKEVGVLEALLLCRDQALTRERFLRHLYDGASYAVDPRIIDVFVCTLGTKLKKAGVTDLIETVMGQGYMIARAP